MEVELITLEDGKTYEIIKEINNYVYLVNEDDENDFVIRKNVIKNGEEFIESLDSDDEFNLALKLLSEDKENLED